MPGKFIFGVPNYFNFNFTVRAGPKPPGLANGTTDVESKSNNNGVLAPSLRSDNTVLAPSISSNSRVMTSSPSHKKRKLDSLPYGSYGTLAKLPSELRYIIYMSVLYHDGYIGQAHRFLGRHPPIRAEDCRYLEVIDAALLRTCRAIYRDAIGILYGRNHFSFRTPMDIKEFAHLGLGTTTFGSYTAPSAALCSKPYGRLTMIRFMNLEFSHGEDNRRNLNKIWSYWSDFFYPSEEQNQIVGFPALKRLALSFIDWNLDDQKASEIRIKPFLRMFRPRGGLTHLTVSGMKNEQNLRDFKHGFVREGGTFRRAPKSPTVETVTVTHEDLPEVSMCVRAIVEKDKASRVQLQKKKSKHLRLEV